METYNHTYRHHNFSHKDLSDLTFTACTFIRSDFRRANLRDTTFVNCKFIEQGDIEGCHFDGKRAARTVLTGMCYSVGSATRQGSSS
ncbi:pentapeptide repeat-containing protein, partial [Klebsiella pneumoniae]|nr:pentapeptide repeat-containing protein [Klebsiella pneumoniae]